MDNRHVVLNKEEKHIILFRRYYRLIVDESVHGFLKKHSVKRCVTEPTSFQTIMKFSLNKINKQR